MNLRDTYIGDVIQILIIILLLAFGIPVALKLWFMWLRYLGV